MDLEDLIRLLEIARNQNCGGVTEAITRDGSSFEVIDVEIGLNTGDVVLRLSPAEATR